MLQHVKKKSPSTIRIILSCYAESATVLEALPLVHQFLSKPCDAKTLRAVIERCGIDSRLSNDQSLSGLVGSLACLPSEPAVLAELRAAVKRPDATIDELGAICERDPALAAKVLQIANTAHFRGGDDPTSSIRVAVGQLGVDVMTSLATSTMVALPSNPVCAAMITALQQQAIDSAQRARQSIADPARADEAYTAGLLHDIGRLVLAHELGESYRAVIAESETTGGSLWECEQRLLGVTHQVIGAHLLGIWALPHELVEACERHHDPTALPTANAQLVAAIQTIASGPGSFAASRAAS